MRIMAGNMKASCQVNYQPHEAQAVEALAQKVDPVHDQLTLIQDTINKMSD